MHTSAWHASYCSSTRCVASHRCAGRPARPVTGGRSRGLLCSGKTSLRPNCAEDDFAFRREGNQFDSGLKSSGAGVSCRRLKALPPKTWHNTSSGYGTAADFTEATVEEFWLGKIGATGAVGFGLGGCRRLHRSVTDFVASWRSFCRRPSPTFHGHCSTGLSEHFWRGRRPSPFNTGTAVLGIRFWWQALLCLEQRWRATARHVGDLVALWCCYGGGASNGSINITRGTY